MRLNKIQLGLIFTLLFTSSAFACGNSAVKNCPLKPETTAYIDHKESVTLGTDVGKIYQTFVDNMMSLKKTGNFKNFKIANQTMDIIPSYDNSPIATLTFRGTIKFDMNFKAVTNLHNKFKKSTVNISTYDVRVCPE